MKKKMRVVDYDPETIKDLIKEKIPCLYGDVGNTAILERLDFKKAKMVISSVSDKQINKILIKVS